MQALQQAGARYIVVWLLPDLGLTPATFGGPLQPFASQLSGTFNAELTAQLSQAGANVIPLNIPLLLKEGMANPASFGLAADQNLIGTCFSGNGCTMNPTYGINGSTPDPSKLLFNDSVHPTITGQRLIADYTYSLLSAPWELTLLPEMAHGTLRAYQDELRSQWQADWENWQNVGQWRGFVGGGGQRLDFDSQDSAASGDGNGYNLTLGGSYRIDEAWRAGVAAGFYRQKLEAGAKDSDYRMNSYMASAFVQYQENRWWADAALTGDAVLESEFRLAGDSGGQGNAPPAGDRRIAGTGQEGNRPTGNRTSVVHQFRAAVGIPWPCKICFPRMKSTRCCTASTMAWWKPKSRRRRDRSSPMT